MLVLFSNHNFHVCPDHTAPKTSTNGLWQSPLWAYKNATIQYKSTFVRQYHSSLHYSQLKFFLICSVSQAVPFLEQSAVFASMAYPVGARCPCNIKSSFLCLSYSFRSSVLLVVHLSTRCHSCAMQLNPPKGAASQNLVILMFGTSPATQQHIFLHHLESGCGTKSCFDDWTWQRQLRPSPRWTEIFGDS